jgi:general secretion pathway protein D
MRRIWWLLGLLLLVVGCTPSPSEDKPLLAPEDWALNAFEEDAAPFVPLNQKKASQETEIPAAFKRQVSVALTDKSSLKAALAALASEVGVNYRVTGLEGNKDRGLFFSMTRKPFIEVIEALCELASLRYSLHEDLITIEPDTPYLKTYTVAFPTQVRESAHRVSTAINVFATGTGETSALDNGSSSTLKASGKSDFWEEVEEGLEAILDSMGEGEILSLHRQAGLVSIWATKSQHQKIEEYLEMLQRTATAQVLIEAKILEVSLNKAFRNGINWQSFRSGLIAGLPLGNATGGGTVLSDSRAGSSDVFTFGIQNGNLSAIAHFIERFGTVRTLSNPRLTVMNNQTAVLKVARNEIFFRIEYTRNFSSSAGGRDSENAMGHIQTVPIGLILTVQPAIHLETGNVILTLRPTISRIAGTKDDPAVAYLAQSGNSGGAKNATTIKSAIPVVEVREMDSVLTLHSGEVVLLGGLMQEGIKDRARDCRASRTHRA